MNNAHALQTPSEWVKRWAGFIAAGGEVLDLACGSGRHSRYLASAGYRVCAIDRDPQAVAALSGVAGVSAQIADLEGERLPLEGRRFAGIVVANYLYRPLFPRLLEVLAEDGALIYETFAQGNERFGKPSNPDFLLRPGELLELVRGKLRVLAFEDLQVSLPRPAMMQRICAVGPRWKP
ncbi:MAG: class I SAM-dependent methyltransferase [Betaproteobacteria bacterium]